MGWQVSNRLQHPTVRAIKLARSLSWITAFALDKLKIGPKPPQAEDGLVVEPGVPGVMDRWKHGDFGIEAAHSEALKAIELSFCLGSARGACGP